MPVPFLLFSIPHYPQLRLRRYQYYIRHTIADALLRFLNHMAINISGGGHMGIAETVAVAHAVDSVEEQYAGLRVPECVWIDMGQPAHGQTRIVS